ncbi:MAG: cryptochrome/photolyase family protein [Sphingobacteriia bacterium]|nr:cryptochrome/photolyase family protein [Sphingobacteriia bacterium]
MNSVFLLFPHQLFQNTQTLQIADEIFLVEESLYFTYDTFHRQKLIFHRASMKYYADYLDQLGFGVQYIEATNPLHNAIKLLEDLKKQEVKEIHYYDVCDNWLEKKLYTNCAKWQLRLIKHESDLFLNTEKDLADYFYGKQQFFHHKFYVQQRLKRKILVDSEGWPSGGKWSFDKENRSRYPINKIPPLINFPIKNAYHVEAEKYVNANFPNTYGDIGSSIVYPVTHSDALSWVEQFLRNRFADFGIYEDAILENESILHHSMFTPLLNTGLITANKVLEITMQFASEHKIEVNSLEGFVRQILGWREFIRGIYIYKGSAQRTKNFWGFSRKIPPSFYTATTGIVPIDTTIKKVLRTGYCHHIERLMILGNFMLLCEFDPDEVYKWFMRMFVDAYDWVMVPNIYGMSQFADGGLMSTKPYISGSAYILKMSDYKKADWCFIWDGLYWQFIDKHRAFFKNHPRLGMMVSILDKMDSMKKNNLSEAASTFLSSLNT